MYFIAVMPLGEYKSKAHKVKSIASITVTVNNFTTTFYLKACYNKLAFQISLDVNRMFA